MVNPNTNQAQPFLINQAQIPHGEIKPLHLAATDTVALGDTYYSDGTNFIRLPVGANGSIPYISGGIPVYLSQGTSGQVLTSDGAGGLSYTTLPTPPIGISGSGVVVCTVNTTVNSGVATDITGATVTFTPSAASYMMVTASFDISVGTAGELFLGYLTVDGSQQSAVATFFAAANNDRKTVIQTWRVSLSVASHTIKLQGIRNSGAGSATYNADHTRFTYILFNQ